jgi:hypothetical protein
MWSVADRIVKTVSDMTVGTVIVLVHVAIADRQVARERREMHATMSDGTKTWRSQISP